MRCIIPIFVHLHARPGARAAAGAGGVQGPARLERRRAARLLKGGGGGGSRRPGVTTHGVDGFGWRVYTSIREKYEELYPAGGPQERKEVS